MIRRKARRPRAELRSPYPGIRPFRRDEARIFFGRDEQIEQLLFRLQRTRFLAVVGASGSGKSSLVKAGLIPKLEGGELGEAGSNWRIADLRPGTSPLLNLAREILRCGILGDDWPNDEQNFGLSLGLLLARLQVGPRALIELLRDRRDLGHDEPPENLLIVADQFEEIFRFYSDQTANEALKFVNLLMATGGQQQTAQPGSLVAAADSEEQVAAGAEGQPCAEDADDVRAYVVITMRSDFLGECALFPQLPELLNDAQFLCPRLLRDQMREAIMLPAKLLRVGEVQAELASTMIYDVGADSDQLPLIQHCLARMWDRAPSSTPRTLTLDQYEGESADPTERSVFVAISHHADEILAGLDDPDDPESRRLVEFVFRALATRGPTGQMIKRSVSLRQLAEESSPTSDPDQVARVETKIKDIVEAFRADGHNFLLPSVIEFPELRPETMVEISHESLLRHWRKLRQWQLVEADAEAELRNLVHEANRWHAAKDSRLLLTGFRLEQMLQWQRKLPSKHWPLRYVSKAELERADQFLGASEANQQAIRAKEQERLRIEREREIAHLTKRDKDKRLEAEAKTRRRTRIAYLVAVGLVVALGLMSWAFRERSHAVGEREKAKTAQKIAEGAKSDADTARKDQTLMADAFRMMLRATDSQETAPLRSSLIGIEALRFARRVKGHREIAVYAADTLRASLSKIGGIGLTASQGRIEHIAVLETPKGDLSWVAASGADGSLVLWDRRAGPDHAAGRAITFGYEAPIRSLRISDDGRWLIVKSGADLHTLWNLADLEAPPQVIRGYSDHYYGVTAAKSYLLLHQRYYGLDVDAVRLPTTSVPLIDLSQNAPLARPITLENFPASEYSSFSRDGAWLALTTANATASVYDLSQAAPGKTLQPINLTGPKTAKSIHPKPFVARNGALNDDASQLIAYLSDATVRIWKRQGNTWRSEAEDARLRGFDGSLRPVVKTDGRGLCALVASQQEQVAPDARESKDPRGLYSFVALQFPKTVDPSKAALGLFFDATKLNAPIHLGSIDAGFVAWLESERNVQVNAAKNWLAIRYKIKVQSALQVDGIRLWNLDSPGTAAPVAPIFLEVREGLSDFLLTSDGKWLIARSFDNTVRVWDLASIAKGNHTPVVVRGHDGVVSTLALKQTHGTVANHWLVTGGSDGSLRLWDLQHINTSADRTTYRAPSGPYYSRLSFNNAVFAQSAAGGAVRIWNLAAGSATAEPDHTIRTKTTSYASLGLSDDGRWLATCAPENSDSGALWRLGGKDKPARWSHLQGVQGEIRRLEVTDAAHADAQWVVAEVDDRRSRTPKILFGKLSGPAADEPVVLKPLPEVSAGRFFLGLIRSSPLYLVQDGEALSVQQLGSPGQTLIGPKVAGNLVFFANSPDLSRLVVKREKESFALFTVSWMGESAIDKVELRTASKASVADSWFIGMQHFHVADHWAILEVKDGKDQMKLFVWDLRGEPSGSGPDKHLVARSVDVSPSRGKRLSISSPDWRWLLTNPSGPSELWDMNVKEHDGLPPKTVLGHFSSSAFSPDGSWLITESRNERKISVWNLRGDKPKLDQQLDVDNAFYLEHAAVSGSGNRLALSEKGSSTRVWDLGENSKAMPRSLDSRELTNPILFLGRSGSHLTFVDPFLNALSSCPLTVTAFEKTAAETIGRNLSEAEWADLAISQGYQRTFPQLLVPAQPMAPSPALRESQVRQGKAKAVPERTLMEGDYELTNADPIDNRKHNSKTFPVELAKGNTYVIDMKSEFIDCYLRLLDPEGQQAAFNDDILGSLDARITYVAKRSGRYTIVATTFNGKNGIFHLSARQQTKILPAVADTLAFDRGKAQQSGELTWSDYEFQNVPFKVYAVPLTKGQLCQIDLDSNDFDASLRLEEPDGTALYSNNDGGGGANARIVFPCDQSTTYRVVVTSAVARTGSFQLTVQTR